MRGQADMQMTIHVSNKTRCGMIPERVDTLPHAECGKGNQ
jgi:hypothetical protein